MREVGRWSCASGEEGGVGWELERFVRVFITKDLRATHCAGYFSLFHVLSIITNYDFMLLCYML